MSDDHQHPDDSFFKLLSFEDQAISELGLVTACDLRTRSLG